MSEVAYYFQIDLLVQQNNYQKALESVQHYCLAHNNKHCISFLGPFMYKCMLAQRLLGLEEAQSAISDIKKFIDCD